MVHGKKSRRELLRAIAGLRAQLDRAGRRGAEPMDGAGRREFETDRKESEEKFRTIFEASPYAVALASFDEGRNLAVNRAYIEFFGYSETELVGRTPLELGIWVDPAERDAARELLRKDGQVRDLEVHHRTRSGEFKNILMSVSLLRLKDRLCMIVVNQDMTERKRLEETLRRSRDELATNQAKLGLAMDLARLAQWEYDIATDTFFFDDRFYALYATTARREGGCAMSSKNYAREFLPPSEAGLVASEIAKNLAFENPTYSGQLEHHIIRRDRARRTIEVRYFVVLDGAGRPVRTIGANQDVTEIRQVSKALRESEERYRLLAENSHDFICVLDQDCRYLYANQNYQAGLGYDPDQLLGQTPLEGTHPDDAPKLAKCMALALAGQGKAAVELRKRDRCGAWRWFEAVLGAYETSVGEKRLVVTSRDITSRKETESHLLHQALHDSLTGLPNRTLFLDRLDQAIRLSRRCRESLFAVLFVDLDRFKVINDSLGHAVGDKIIKAAGRLIRDSLREHDTVARIGGDEFCVLLEGLRSHKEAILAVRRIQDRLGARMTIEGHELPLSASIGIVLGTTGGSSMDILRNADIAMYYAKKRGVGRFKVFTATLHDQVLGNLRLECGLRRAVERREFEVFYQPIVALDTGCLHGLEALVRWRHPARGLVPPMEFIPLAEETGLIGTIGQQVLEEACAQVGAWNGALDDRPPLVLHVNLSPRQVLGRDLPKDIEAALSGSGLSPRLLNLEITETAIIESPRAVKAALLRLKSMGVRLSLDDFGTGYSPLGSFSSFPIDTLKIDKSFIMRLQTDIKSTEIVKAILNLANSLGKEVIAEGVETFGQAEYLRQWGCRLAQGYAYSRPLDAKSAACLLSGDIQGQSVLLTAS